MPRRRRTGAPPSVKDVASLAGVSVGTVSNALNYPDKVSPELVTRVTEAIAKLGYVRNEAARQLRVGQSDTVGLIVPHFQDAFFGELARGVDDAAAERGLSVLAGSSNEDSSRESQLLSLFEKYRVSGIIIAPHALPLPLNSTATARIPLVLVGRNGKDLGLSSVCADDYGAGVLAASHLIDQGATRVAVLTMEPGWRATLDERERGALQTLTKSRDLEVEVIRATELSVEAGREIGRTLMERSQEDRPDAVFATHDLWAIGILHALQAAEPTLAAPEIAVIGCEDVDAHHIAPVALTSIQLPAYDMGVRALTQLVDAGESLERSIEHASLPPTLIARESSLRRSLPQTR